MILRFGAEAEAASSAGQDDASQATTASSHFGDKANCRRDALDISAGSGGPLIAEICFVFLQDAPVTFALLDAAFTTGC